MLRVRGVQDVGLLLRFLVRHRRRFIIFDVVIFELLLHSSHHISHHFRDGLVLLLGAYLGSLQRVKELHGHLAEELLLVLIELNPLLLSLAPLDLERKGAQVMKQDGPPAWKRVFKREAAFGRRHCPIVKGNLL